MYDASKIIPGLVIFVILLTSPIWYSAASGRISYVSEPEIVTEEKQCVESAQYMRENHMDMLDEWRQLVVREGEHTYIPGDGKEYEISLTDTCMTCHSNKEEFCDRCHDYTGVEPDCWDCHNAP
ncbi:sulfate reduction electron transfer complex DsrMKJOP subunit DsrJ [Chloroflexota bacterium]